MEKSIDNKFVYIFFVILIVKFFCNGQFYIEKLNYGEIMWNFEKLYNSVLIIKIRFMKKFGALETQIN